MTILLKLLLVLLVCSFLRNNASPPLDNIGVMVIVWRLRANIIRTALCWIVWHNVHSPQHTYVSRSYRSNILGLSHWDIYAVRRGGCLELYYCNMVEWFWWDSNLISTTNWFPSVLWHCWFGHLACKFVSEMTYYVSSGRLNHTHLHSEEQPSILSLTWPLTVGGCRAPTKMPRLTPSDQPADVAGHRPCFRWQQAILEAGRGAPWRILPLLNDILIQIVQSRDITAARPIDIFIAVDDGTL